jgi:Sugar-binding cellulase-like
MTFSRRDIITYGAAGALAAVAPGRAAAAQPASQDTTSSSPSPMPLQEHVPTVTLPSSPVVGFGGYDMRDSLRPQRLTIAMWDQAFLMRHMPGGSFADYDRVLDETVERGYNTVRLDPLPQYVDLRKPDQILSWGDPHQPFMPWGADTAVSGPIGNWIIDFIEKLHKRPSLNYTLSAWWGMSEHPPVLRRPKNMLEGAEMWAVQLTDWKKRFGFDRLVYVDLANETPYFFPGLMERFKKVTGASWGESLTFSPAQISFLAEEVNKPLALLRGEFPELRFTVSIHGDLRWLHVPVELDCLDVHFYADADPRWTHRTRFDKFISEGLFKNDSWFAQFSERATKTSALMAPMLRARQRFKMGQFATWAAETGSPLTTSEAWSSWYYFDSPNLDWSWLLDWSAWTVEDAIACKFWGWTTFNYAQPQFAVWKDVPWHRALNERFLQSPGD